MTRNDYILIAEAVRKSDTKGEIIENLCSQLKSDNSRFDKDTFRAACGAFDAELSEVEQDLTRSSGVTS